MQIRWDKSWGIPLISGTASFIVGTGVGYMLASIRLGRKVRDIQESQRILREHFESRMEALAEVPREEEAMYMHKLVDESEEGRAQEIYEDFEPVEEEHIPNNFTVQSHISFDHDDDDWDYEVEVPKRNPQHPYIIHRDEFMAEESGYSQSTLTYYAGDNILCDERDQPIYNHEIVAGTLRFGHGSKDPTIVYVRNTQLEAEYEIILDEGYYQVQVLGAVIEDEMSEGDVTHSVRRFKKD